MRKINFLWIFTFALLIPLVLGSCASKDDMTGEFKANKRSCSKLIEFKDIVDDAAIKMSLKKDGSATAALYLKIKKLDKRSGKEALVSCDVEYTGKWDFNTLFKTLNLKLEDDFEITNLDMKVDGESMPKSEIKKYKKQIKKELENQELIKGFTDIFAADDMKVSDIDGNGFTLQNEEGEPVRFKRVK